MIHVTKTCHPPKHNPCKAFLSTRGLNVDNAMIIRQGSVMDVPYLDGPRLLAAVEQSSGSLTFRSSEADYLKRAADLHANEAQAVANVKALKDLVADLETAASARTGLAETITDLDEARQHLTDLLVTTATQAADLLAAQDKVDRDNGTGPANISVEDEAGKT